MTFPAPAQQPGPQAAVPAGANLEPVSREVAKAQLKVARRKGKSVIFVAALAYLGVFVSALFLSDPDTFGPVPAIAMTLSLIGGVLASLRARRALRAVRYRVTPRTGPWRLAGVLVVAYVLFGVAFANFLVEYGPIDPGFYDLARVLAAPAAVAMWLHVLFSTQLSVQYEGIAVRRYAVEWHHVAAIVITRGVAPGTVEVGVRPSPASRVPWLRFRHGELLTDLPLRVVMRESTFDLDRLHWGANQSGRTDIDIVERTVTGERLLRRTNQPMPLLVGSHHGDSRPADHRTLYPPGSAPGYPPGGQAAAPHAWGAPAHRPE